MDLFIRVSEVGLSLWIAETVMTRLVRHDAQEPREVKVGDQSVWICMCGLSKNKPFCDGSHKMTKNEQPGQTYIYDKAGNRVEVSSMYD